MAGKINVLDHNWFCIKMVINIDCDIRNMTLNSLGDK